MRGAEAAADVCDLTGGDTGAAMLETLRERLLSVQQDFTSGWVYGADGKGAGGEGWRALGPGVGAGLQPGTPPPSPPALRSSPLLRLPYPPRGGK